MANNVDPNQMPHYAASDLGLHCLQRPICPNTQHFVFSDRPDVKFYTDNMPERFSLFQDCYDKEYEGKKDALMKQIDLLIQNTKLTFAPNR